MKKSPTKKKKAVDLRAMAEHFAHTICNLGQHDEECLRLDESEAYEDRTCNCVLGEARKFVGRQDDFEHTQVLY